ncbi:MurR/RpiR family transcriptional regulator [Sporolactobacillus vineae]|uniref:MurR/RpiR family transcriptional regulator n=1 Tax=Sporolactobacillus vineae TaxID=444463 RepID=UPI00028960B6|nr:MurR/RpiR family transcriptional regulator [Sporolactobacillus vineae]
MNFFDRLRIKYTSLTKTGKRIAEFLFEDAPAFTRMTAAEIGRRSSTSPAAVIRFCKQMECGSLEQLKMDIVRAINPQTKEKMLNPIFMSTDNTAQITEKYYHYRELSNKRVFQMVDIGLIEKTVELMHRAKMIYLFGINASSLAAYDLEHKLNRVNIPAVFHQDPHMNLEFSVGIKPEDLAIAISYSGETREVLLAAAKAKEKGAQLVAITQDNKNPLSRIADILLAVPSDEKRLRIAAVSSRLSQMFYTDLLYLCLIQKDFDRVSDYLYETSELVNKLL